VNKLAIIVLTLGLMACGGKKKDEPAAGSGSAAMAGSGSAMMAGSGSAMMGSGSAMAGSGSGSAAAGSGSSAKADVPTEQDFEQEAAKDIDDKNVEAKVGEIEKQIGQ